METITPSDVERQLLESYVTARQRVSALTDQLDEAKKLKDEAEDKLYTLMQAEGKKKTADYEGLGFVSIAKPEVYASCVEENKPLLFAYLKDVGRDDMIKPTVHPRSLSSFAKEKLENGEEIPQFISYYLKNNIKFYARS